jgi:hypothetical protein
MTPPVPVMPYEVWNIIKDLDIIYDGRKSWWHVESVGPMQLAVDLRDNNLPAGKWTLIAWDEDPPPEVHKVVLVPDDWCKIVHGVLLEDNIIRNVGSFKVHDDSHQQAIVLPTERFPRK